MGYVSGACRRWTFLVLLFLLSAIISVRPFALHRSLHRTSFSSSFTIQTRLGKSLGKSLSQARSLIELNVATPLHNRDHIDCPEALSPLFASPPPAPALSTTLLNFLTRTRKLETEGSSLENERSNPSLTYPSTYSKLHPLPTGSGPLNITSTILTLHSPQNSTLKTTFTYSEPTLTNSTQTFTFLLTVLSSPSSEPYIKLEPISSTCTSPVPYDINKMMSILKLWTNVGWDEQWYLGWEEDEWAVIGWEDKWEVWKGVVDNL